MSQEEYIQPQSLIDKLIYFCLKNKVLVGVFLLLILGWGIFVAPFDWNTGGITRQPVSVDAIPDIGENQQIVFTKWEGRSPQDVEDQVSYPLTVSLLGIPKVKTVRSLSMFGFSTIYVIFEEDAEFYWSRARIIEKLNSLPSNLLPNDVRPSLGPDATALGQVFWYTLEGQDDQGNPTGGWGPEELRSIQDWQVKYALLSAEGVSEVASVGGYVKEYQIDVDPEALRAYNLSIEDVFKAVQMANLDVGAKSIEVNKVEYFIRGLGFIKTVSDIENSVITVHNNTPVYVRNVAHVSIGPALRRGALDKEGAEVAGGVVVARYGENPLKAINSVKEKIREISVGLPKKTLPDGTVSQVRIVPFYDRSEIITDTLATLNKALSEEIIITVIVILLLVMNITSSVLISAALPLAVLMVFIAMKVFGVDANIVALSGIAIAIGTIVDMGIVVTVNIMTHMKNARPEDTLFAVVYRASTEVGSAILTAVATTVISFLPVFTMIGAEGKLFRPLAFTKTFALLASIIIAVTILPAAAELAFRGRYRKQKQQQPDRSSLSVRKILVQAALVLIMLFLLTRHWMPLGAGKSTPANFTFVLVIVSLILGSLYLYQRYYTRIIGWCFKHLRLTLTLPVLFVGLGMMVWLGIPRVFGFLPQVVQKTPPYTFLARNFPGIGKEFMPSLDEGSFLLMPVTMAHASIGESLDVLQKQNTAIRQIPEVDNVVGKVGRVDSALDPAPLSMIETVISYRKEYLESKQGKIARYRFDPHRNDYFRDVAGNPVNASDGRPYIVKGAFVRDKENRLIADSRGQPFRLWRPALLPGLNQGRTYWKGVNSPDDIWNSIREAATIPGATQAPKLQPIEARLVMLQTGVRAPMAIKIKGPDLPSIERFGMELEQLLKTNEQIEPATVYADRVIGKPYLELKVNREAIARYGIRLKQVLDTIEMAVGGKTATVTVEGRERYDVRVRYQRELRDSIETLEEVYVTTADGQKVPMKQLATLEYVRGPQVIKGEDTFLVSYVLFDKKAGLSEGEVVGNAGRLIDQKISSGELTIPEGVSYSFTGNYENLLRSEKTLMIVLPLALALILLILYLQFRSLIVSLLVFTGIIIAWSGGFLLIWLYGQPWFMNIPVLGVNLRELFQIAPVNMSVAVWVGFLALFGIASDDGVIVATYLQEVFRRKTPQSVKEIRAAAAAAGNRRVKQCIMTTATTLIALLPVLTSSGRGADIMIPMAIPTFGGMLAEVSTVVIVPVLYSLYHELRLRYRGCSAPVTGILRAKRQEVQTPKDLRN